MKQLKLAIKPEWAALIAVACGGSTALAVELTHPVPKADQLGQAPAIVPIDEEGDVSPYFHTDQGPKTLSVGSISTQIIAPPPVGGGTGPDLGVNLGPNGVLPMDEAFNHALGLGNFSPIPTGVDLLGAPAKAPTQAPRDLLRPAVPPGSERVSAPAAVPTPGGVFLMGVAAGVFGLRRRRS